MKKIFIYGSPHFIDKNIGKETPSYNDTDVEIFFGDELKKTDFFDFTNSISLFGNQKYAIVRNTFKISEIEEFIKNIKKISETSLIFSAEPTGNKTDRKILKFFKESSFDIREESTFNKATSMDVMKIFKEKGIPVSAVNASYILNVTGGDMFAVENEAEKLYLYLSSNKNASTDDVIKYIAGEKEEKIYMVVSNFAKKNTKNCLEIYNIIPNTYENNLFLFFGMAKFVYNVYYSYIDPALTDTKTQFQRNLMDNKRLWSKEETAETIGYMAQLDFNIKTGRISFENAIEDVILSTSKKQ